MTALDERAAYWAIRVDAGDLTAQEEAELAAWTGTDTRHAGAFARAMAANAYFSRAAALGAHHGDDISVQSAATENGHVEDIPTPRFRSGKISRRAWIGGGLGAIAAVLVGGVSVSLLSGTEHIMAPLGNVRRASLRDGTAVTLNSTAEIRVTLGETERHVKLVAGEANFDVAKDPSRPFLIDAGPVRIRVVGTSFIVRLIDENHVSVTVREGIVEASRSGYAPIRLTAGDHVVLGSDGPPRYERLSAVDVDRIGLWQRGEMDLTSMTLGDAAREFARYSDQHILIDDPAVRRLKVAGVYSTSDPAGFAHAAALAQGLKASVTEEAITLSQ